MGIRPGPRPASGPEPSFDGCLRGRLADSRSSLHARDMKLPCVLFCLFSLAPLFPGEDFGRLIFQDDFSRNESQEKTDDPGNGWATNSKSRAKEHKQVDLSD